MPPAGVMMVAIAIIQVNDFERRARPIIILVDVRRTSAEHAESRMVGMMTQQNILVVDDEAPMRKLLTSNLRAGGYAVHQAVDGVEALQLIQEYPFDLLLLDMVVPGPHGLDVLEAVRREGSVPVMVVSGRAREQDKVAAFDLGADDYVTKPFGIPELMARVRAVLRRGGDAPRALNAYHYDGLEVDFAARRATVNGVHAPLTRREFEVLAYLARNAGKTLLHREVLQAVWGGQYGNESDYVWTFVRRIRRKIEPDPGHPHFILTEQGVGYRMPAPDEWRDYAPLYPGTSTIARPAVP